MLLAFGFSGRTNRGRLQWENYAAVRPDKAFPEAVLPFQLTGEHRTVIGYDDLYQDEPMLAADGMLGRFQYYLSLLKSAVKWAQQSKLGRSEVTFGSAIWW